MKKKKLEHFHISTKDSQGLWRIQVYLDAIDAQTAAVAYVRNLYNSECVTAMRLTGDEGKYGQFQAWGWCPVTERWHRMEKPFFVG